MRRRQTIFGWVLCTFGLHATPRGWNPDFSWGCECSRCGAPIKGRLR